MRKLMLVLCSLVMVGLLALMAVSPVSACAGWHIVRRGETIFSIGRLYNVNPWYIARANGLVNPNVIYVGQRIHIPCGPGYWPPYPYCPGCCGSTYIVRYGDTLSSIAWRYGVSAWHIAQVNHIPNMNYIWAGQRLYIPCY